MTELAQADMQMLTQSVIQYLDEWKLSPSEIIKLLGVDGLVPLRQFQLYRKGEKALPQTPRGDGAFRAFNWYCRCVTHHLPL